MSTQKHPFHLVDPSPWPLFGSLGAFASTMGGVMYMHSYTGGGALLSLGLGMLIYTMIVWWRDVVREATYEGHHTGLVQIGLRYGMILFIVSEVMFFLAFFWAFFHSSLAPTVEIGAIWPPKGIEVLNPWNSILKYFNTSFVRCGGYLGTSCNSCRKETTSYLRFSRDYLACYAIYWISSHGIY
jgi:cytochrome c oxidase subunit 3